MKIIQHNTTKVATHMFGDGNTVLLTIDGLVAPGINSGDYTTENYELLEDVVSPPAFVGGAMTLTNDGWTITDSTLYNRATDIISNKLRADAKRRMVKWIEAYLHENFTGKYPKEEVNSWSEKASAARNHIAGNATPIQLLMLIEEANILQTDELTLAGWIVAKADLFTVIISKVSGLRQVTEAAIDSALPSQIDDVLEASIAQAEAMAAQIGA